MIGVNIKDVNVSLYSFNLSVENSLHMDSFSKVFVKSINDIPSNMFPGIKETQVTQLCRKDEIF